jgi:hypothetical protein
MEVKDKSGFGAVPLGDDGVAQAVGGRPGGGAPANTSLIERADSLELSSPSGGFADLPNEIINVINLATEATSEVELLVRHLDGIVKQVTAPDVSAVRVAALEREAQETARSLVTRRFEPPPGLAAESLDATVRRELAQTLGRTLEFLLPERLQTELDFGQIDFSTKEAILQTQTTVEIARRRLDEMKTDLDGSRDVVRRVVATADVAAENKRAAGSTIRDLEQATELATRTGLGLLGDRSAALGAFGKLSDRSLKALL